MTFSLVWADKARGDEPWGDAPHHFHVNNTTMAAIRDELEAQGAGAYEPEGIRNHPIDLNKLLFNDGRHVTWAECQSILRAVSEDSVLTTDHEEITDENIDGWRDRWKDFVEFLRAASEHDGFYVY